MRFLIHIICLVILPSTALAEQAKCNAIQLAIEEQWDKAVNCANSQRNRNLIKAVQWMKYRYGSSEASFKEISKFVYRNPHFPDIHHIVKNAEGKITHAVSPKELSIWFNRHAPKTSNGFKHYLRTVKEKDKKFPYFVRKAWVYGNFSGDELKDFYSKYRKYLKSSDHYRKIDHALWNGGKTVDSFVLKLLSPEKRKLIKAREALLKNHHNMQQIISSVPKQHRADAGLLYAQAMWHKKRKHDHKLAKLLIDHEKLDSIKGDRWSKIRLVLASELIDDGSYKLAYRIISNHKFKNPVNYVDGEWMAGKIAYLYLKEYNKASTHFQNLLKKSKFSLSRSKGAYWSARTAYRLGDINKAVEFYKIAAGYPDNFYGQLASMKINKDWSVNSPRPPEISKEDIDWANKNNLVQISKLLVENRKHVYARKFIAQAVTRAKTRARRYLLTKTGFNLKHSSLSVVAGKELARRGMFEKNYSYPIKNFKLPFKIELALVNSIIRQESEFDQYAKSSAGAMGLMQLMYPTAKYVAKKVNARLHKKRLFSNAKFNATLGSYYLSELIDRYDGSYVLAIAAYNAGPGNVDKWVSKYGDPRKTKDYNAVVGWIEKIPYYETRGYVQSVLSNLQIYRGLIRDRDNHKIKVVLHHDLIKQSKAKLLG